MNTMTRKLKQGILAVGAACAFTAAGLSEPAHALTVNTNGGELILAIYGNGTEYLTNLGSSATLTAPGANTVIPLSGIQSGVTSPNPVKWSIFSVEYDSVGLTYTGLMAGHTSPLSSWTSSQISNTVPNQAFNQAFPWLFQTAANPGNPENVSSSAQTSFSTMTNNNQSTFAGAYAVGVSGNPGDTLNLVLGTQDTSTLAKTFSAVGTAVLASNLSQITISGNPVPVPAALVLFGTGLVGLAGIARRSMGRRAV